jgi:hypothetical protein
MAATGQLADEAFLPAVSFEDDELFPPSAELFRASLGFGPLCQPLAGTFNYVLS